MEKIHSFALLSQLECQKIHSVVYELKKNWTQRDELGCFYTLGAASYLDATKKREKYCTMAKQHNLILKQNFNWLYKKLLTALSQYLQASTSFYSTAALPGFHIYLASKFWQNPQASIHCDLQYQLIEWKNPAATYCDRPISFTLPISLPQAGSGLNIWDIPYKEAVNLSKADLKQLFKTRSKSFYPYSIGQLIIHSGLNAHQIEFGSSFQSNDDRITLQGHGILSQKKWQIYW